MTTNRDGVHKRLGKPQATTPQVYEGKILETLIKNSERLAIVEQKLIVIEQKFDQKIVTLDQKIEKLDTKVDNYKWFFWTIIVGIIIRRW